MKKTELILNFIKQFRDLGAENCFSNGMCWHFTLILRARFGYENFIMYDPVINHFATEIDGRIYDITGDITDNSEYHWHRWMEYLRQDPVEARRIYRDCIYKVPSDKAICMSCEHHYSNINNEDLCDLDYKPIDFYGPCRKEELLSVYQSKPSMDG